MNAIQAKLVVAGAMLAGAVGYLVFAGARSGWVYFIDVEKFLAEPDQWRSSRVRIHGTVGEEEFAVSTTGQAASFVLVADGAPGHLPVSYKGNIPEMFGAGKSVVIEGKCDAQGVFQADVLMTKCASKYEPTSPHAEGQ